MVSFDLSTLPPPQQRLWDRLGQTPNDFVLYGGTALALRLGHRQSEDFDFFSRHPFDPDDLLSRIDYLSGAEQFQKARNTLGCAVQSDDAVVRVSFFGGLDLRSVSSPDRADGPGILVASVLDIAATKAGVVQARGSAKDYLDIDALISRGVSLTDALGAANAVYGDGFNPLLTLKALTYFGEQDLDSVPNEVRQRLADAVAQVRLDGLPVFSSRALPKKQPAADYPHDR